MNNQAIILDQIAPAIGKIKAAHKATWEDGDYCTFAKFMEPGAIEVLKDWSIAPNCRLLDIACGSGQTAIPAAEQGAQVTGIDLAENLILHARKRAQQNKLSAQFDVGDAENLPYSHDSFDAIITMFGAMFAPRPQVVVDEFARVLTSGGKLYMANWTSSSMPAKMFASVGKVNPPPVGLASPLLWGDEDTVLDRLSEDFTDITLQRRIYPLWHYPCTAEQLVNVFKSYFGPVKRAFDKADADQAQTLQQELVEIYSQYSEYSNDMLTITGGEFLQVIATRR